MLFNYCDNAFTPSLFAPKLVLASLRLEVAPQLVLLHLKAKALYHLST